MMRLLNFFQCCQLIRMNQMEQGSSSESDNIFSRFKKVEYEGVISEESSLQDGQSQFYNSLHPKQKRKSYTKKIQSLQKENESQQEDADRDLSKTKNIKKNCVSAKRSRQRKRLYIELLQDKAEAYKNEIIQHRDRINQQKEQILKITKETNPEKYIYISQKIKDSQGIVSFLHSNQAKDTSTLPNINKKYSKQRETIKGSPEALIKQQNRSVKSGKSLKNQLKKQQSQPTCSQQQRVNLNRIVDSFMYKFGFNGVLKNDVIQFQKQHWCELAIEEKFLQDKNKTQQLQKNLNDFQSCMNSLDQNSRRIEYLVRKLRDQVSDKYVAEILLDKLFLQKKDEMEDMGKEKPE